MNVSLGNGLTHSLSLSFSLSFRVKVLITINKWFWSFFARAHFRMSWHDRVPQVEAMNEKQRKNSSTSRRDFKCSTSGFISDETESFVFWCLCCLLCLAAVFSNRLCSFFYVAVGLNVCSCKMLMSHLLEKKQQQINKETKTNNNSVRSEIFLSV